MYTHHRSLFAEAWQQQLAGDNEMFVVDLDGFPVAQAWADLAKRRQESAAVLWAVRVFPFLSGQGIGSWMLLQLEEILRVRGLRWLEVGVEKNNPRARQLYERLCYQYVADVCESYSYTPPMGVTVYAVADQWLFRKRLL